MNHKHRVQICCLSVVCLLIALADAFYRQWEMGIRWPAGGKVRPPQASAFAEEYHVSINGHDGSPGTEVEPFRTISAAALIAEPGDTVTVHEGVYRERMNPPRDGGSDKQLSGLD